MHQESFMRLRKACHNDIAEKDALEIFVEGDNIILHKYHPSCVFCENTKNIISYKGKNVCPDCIKKLKEKI